LPWRRIKYYIFWVRFCSLRYHTWNAHVPCYSVIYGLSCSTFFPTLSHSGVINRGAGVLNIKCVFSFPLQLWSAAFFILRRIQRDITNAHTSSCKVPFILVILNQTLIFSTDFRKIFKFHKTSTSGSPAVPRSLTGTHGDGRTDRQDEANGRFSHICERVYNLDPPLTNTILFIEEYVRKSNLYKLKILQKVIY